MAFGGVATGNMNAQDAATVAETKSIYGCTSIEYAIGAKMGSNIAVVARLEVISVKKFTAVINIRKCTKLEDVNTVPDKLVDDQYRDERNRNGVCY